MKIPIQNIYYLLCYAWNKLDEKDIVDEDTVDKVISLCNWQLKVRQLHDPIDADSKMAKVE